MERELRKLDVDGLLALRGKVDEELKSRAKTIQIQLDRLGNGHGRGRKGRSPMLGRKVPAKYRGPNGETWAGRGATPRWLTALAGKNKKKIESYRVKGA